MKTHLNDFLGALAQTPTRRLIVGVVSSLIMVVLHKEVASDTVDAVLGGILMIANALLHRTDGGSDNG